VRPGREGVFCPAGVQANMPGTKHNSMIGEEIAGMRREIDQARELLLDAIGKLTAGFAGVRDVIAESGQAPSAKLDQEISAIVTALQFQDLLDQILGHALRRLDAIEGALGIVTEGSGAAETAPRGKPVAQRQMDAGDMELF